MNVAGYPAASVQTTRRHIGDEVIFIKTTEESLILGEGGGDLQGQGQRAGRSKEVHLYVRFAERRSGICVTVI